MFNKMVVYEALKRSDVTDLNRRDIKNLHTGGQDSLISLLIHDIFGGEILKTHSKRKWHFYNRIEGERVDFTGSDALMTGDDLSFEDIPSSPDETSNYIDQTDYTSFLMRFVRVFEETIGLDRYQAGYSA